MLITNNEREGTKVELATKVGFFRQEQVVTIPTVVKVGVTDLVNIIFGAGLYTLSWWGNISFSDKNGNLSFDEIDRGEFDAETLEFSVEFEDEDNTELDSNKFLKKVITLSDLVNAISTDQTFANAIATEDVDVWVADSILQQAIYGKAVWG